jgi:glycosyltransferase involved in cell wall biosynthesis
LRILHVITTLSPVDGGPPHAVRQLALAWAQIDVEAEVVTLDAPSEPFLQGLPFPVHALHDGQFGRFRYSRKLGPWLRQNLPRFDGVVVHGLWTYHNLAVRREARRAGKPYGVFTHGGIDPWFNKKYPGKYRKKKLFWPWQYPVLRDAVRVFFTSDVERNLAKTSFQPNKWTPQVVRYGLNDPTGDPRAQIEAFLEKFPALRGRRYLFFLGRLHEKKGCDLLVRAFASIAASAPELQLVIAGPDQEGGALRAAEAFVLPSHQENFGIAVAESLAAGRPVLISNEVNIWREIQADGVGLVEPDTLEGTEKLLQGWLALSEAERAAMASRCYDAFRRRYLMKETVLAIQRTFAGG